MVNWYLFYQELTVSDDGGRFQLNQAWHKAITRWVIVVTNKTWESEHLAKQFYVLSSKSEFSQPFKMKCISEVVRIRSRVPGAPWMVRRETSAEFNLERHRCCIGFLFNIPLGIELSRLDLSPWKHGNWPRVMNLSLFSAVLHHIGEIALDQDEPYAELYIAKGPHYGRLSLWNLEYNFDVLFVPFGSLQPPLDFADKKDFGRHVKLTTASH